jgi:hypothetical protein
MAIEFEIILVFEILGTTIGTKFKKSSAFHNL